MNKRTTNSPLINVGVPLVVGAGLVVLLLWMTRANVTGAPASIAYAANSTKLATDTGDVYCVTLGGGGPYPGCAQVFTSVQSALDTASGGEIIKIASGVYSDVYMHDGITQVAYISKTVTIRGGYTTTTGFDDPPNPNANPTTLDAKGQGRVIYITGDVSPTIEGLRITGGNATGLGPFNTDSGGGVYINASASFNGNQVFSNTAFNGGGIYVHESAPMLDANVFFSNTASNGGGLFLNLSNAVLTNNTIISNSVDRNGGGLSLQYSDATLSGNSIISNDAAWDGGGGYLFDSDATLSSNSIIANVAGQVGGGLYTFGSAGVFENNVITDNRSGDGGSGLHIEYSSPYLLHNTIARNSSGIYITDWQWNYSTVVMTNTILVSHTVGVYVTPGSTIRLEATLWGTGTWSNGEDWSGAGTIITGTVNIWDEPSFINPDAGDYLILPDSAAIDAGVYTGVRIDIEGQPRPIQAPDLGADEYWPPGTPKYVYLSLVLRSWYLDERSKR